MVAPLAGIRVIDTTQVLAGPSAAAFMADLGADVIKIEPPGGEGTRRGNLALMMGADVDFNVVFELNNRGKRSV